MVREQRHSHHHSRGRSSHQHSSSSSSSRHHHRHHRRDQPTRSEYSVRLHPTDDDFSFISPCAKYSLFIFNLVCWVSTLVPVVKEEETGRDVMKGSLFNALKAE